MEEAGTPNHFIVLRQEVLYDTNLSLTDKFVYARICTFDEYFESAEACASVLGLSKRQVEEAKRRLEKAGYIECICNTGRGKRYKARYDLQENVGQTHRKLEVRHTENCNSDLQKTVDIEKNIEKNNINCLDKSKQLAEAKEHGNPDINDMFAAWYAVFGFEQKQSAENRRACYNLLRRKDLGKEKLTKMLYILEESQSDKFAPKEVKSIVGFATLQTYLPNLVMWARRRYVQKQPLQGVEI